ncbi:MAG: hypothetical protein EBV06_11530 [Planctomycetia bacterium]|nr:hypothetical protein [Planctomycetia bacterium]
MNPYASLCDDFGAYVYLSTKMDLPNSREPVLHFFDSLKRAFPVLTDFDHRDSGDYVLEEDREQGSHRWVTLETRRLCAGYLNPPSLDAADQFHEHVLETAPYHLDLSGLDCEALDALYAFDFVYQGNHDEVVAEALGMTTTLDKLVSMPGTKVINYEPSLMLALDDACRLQCRLSIETRTNAFQVRTGTFPEAPISVYFTVRQYWSRSPHKTFIESFKNQRRVLQELIDQHVIPSIVRPLAQTIAAKQ